MPPLADQITWSFRWFLGAVRSVVFQSVGYAFIGDPGRVSDVHEVDPSVYGAWVRRIDSIR